MSNLIYDNFYIMTLSNDNYTFDENTKGVFSGNGKIAFHNSMHKIGTDLNVISIGEVNFDQIGKYKNNIIQTFSANELRLFTPYDDSNVTYTLESQTINMLNGKCTSVFNVSSNNSIMAIVQNDMVPLRQFPYCSLQRVTITSQTSLQSFDIHHMIKANPSLMNMEYNNNVIYNDKIYDDKGLYIMNASAYNNDTKSTVACASCYLNTSNCLGYNILYKKQGCHQQLRYQNVNDSDVITFDILTATMTSRDFPEPLEEVKRILMNIAFREQQQDSLVEQLENDNSSEWYTIWNSDITLNSKMNATNEEKDNVIKIQRYIRSSLYSIFCCIRLGINTEVNPLHLSYIDTNGNLFYDSDIWLVPSLLFLSPQIAKTLLEFRYKGLEQAVQLAASYGYKGSKYPYQNDIKGYKTLYWDVASPLHIFNNAIISINVWNYFRLTQDIEWLTSKGYPIMKNIADFLISNMNTEYSIPNIVGLGGRTSTNHAFTMYVIKLALKYTIQATIQLEYRIKSSWQEAYQNIQYPVYQQAFNDVIAYDSTFSDSDHINIVDPLLILLSYYSELYFDTFNGTRDYTSIIRNVEYYETKIDDAYESNATNLIILACLYGMISQADNSYLNTFYEKLNSIISLCGENDYWGNLNQHSNDGVNIAICGFFIFIFLIVCGGLKIVGGINEGKIFYKYYGLECPNQINLPLTWKNIIFSGIGNDQELFIVTNSLQNV